MRSAFEGKEIWFLTGSQDLYGEETLAQVAQQSKGVVEQLNSTGEIPVPIVWKPTVKDSESIRRIILEANANDEVIGVITWMHTFSPAKMWINGLGVLGKPLLHLHTQSGIRIPWESIDMDFMNLNQSAHGDREYAYILSRLRISRETVVGHASDPKVRARIATWSRACAGWGAISGMNLVRFGDNMRNVAVTDGDKTEAERVLGVNVSTWSANELVEEIDRVSDGDIDRTCAEYEELYDVAPELRKGGDRHQELRYAASQEVAIRRFLENRNAQAFTTNFEDLGALKQLPGIAVQRLMAEGFGFGAEGDWKTAILVRAVKAMSEGLPGGASLMEDYTYNLDAGNELILGAHMLEICPTLTTKKPKVEIKPLGIGGKEDPVRMIFQTDPGPALVVSLADMGTRFRLTANQVEVVKAPEMPNLPVAHAVWKPAPSLEVSAECWMLSGGAHHTVLTTSIGIEEFRILAELAGLELLVIDQDTKVPDFKNQIHWNYAYYHLANGV